MSSPLQPTPVAPHLPDLIVTYIFGNPHLTWHAGTLSLDGDDIVIRSEMGEIFRVRPADRGKCSSFSIFTTVHLTVPMGVLGSRVLNIAFGDGDYVMQHFPGATVAGYARAQDLEACITSDVLAWQNYLRGAPASAKVRNFTGATRFALIASATVILLLVLVTVATHLL